LEDTFCPLRLIYRSFIELTGVSGFIHQEHIGAIVLTKLPDGTYSYGWILNNLDLEFEIIEELRLAMLMIATRCHFLLFPLAIRNCGTEDMRFCNPEPSKEMNDHIISAERIRLTAFNSATIVTEGDKRRCRDTEMLFRNL
jgi:hypothetical protein